MKVKHLEHVQIGTFEVTQDTLIISDPCYPHGSRGCQKLCSVKPGLWTASIGAVEMEDGERLIAYLSVLHPDCTDIRTLRIHDAPFLIPVDSGQAGIFDFRHYQDPSVIRDQPRFDFGDLWYSACCDQTMDRDYNAGVIPFGVVASSGYGDGYYRCMYLTTQDKQAPITCGAIVDFNFVKPHQILRQLCAK